MISIGGQIPGKLATDAVVALVFAASVFGAETGVMGRVLDPQGKAVAGATVRLRIGTAEITHVASDDQGQFRFTPVSPGAYHLSVEAPGFQAGAEDVTVLADGVQRLDVALSGIAGQYQSVVISGKTVEPTVDLRNAEAFNRTLFTRDDQIMQQLNAGMDAGQHEGGGKVRRNPALRIQPRPWRHEWRSEGPCG